MSVTSRTNRDRLMTPRNANVWTNANGSLAVNGNPFGKISPREARPLSSGKRFGWRTLKEALVSGAFQNWKSGNNLTAQYGEPNAGLWSELHRPAPIKMQIPHEKDTTDKLFGQHVGIWFVIGEPFAKGGFGEVRFGYHKSMSAKKFAVKVESVSHQGMRHLSTEYNIYTVVGDAPGIPRCYYFGLCGIAHNALVMDLLGPSLDDVFESMKRRFTMRTVFLIALQTLERLQYIHAKGVVHGDVKGENFLVGLTNEGLDNVIYIVDFGLSQVLRDHSKGTLLYHENAVVCPAGTPRYMSISAHSGNALSFRDDLESLAYVLVYFIKGRLPWQGIHEKDTSKKSALIKSRKSGIAPEDICSGCPAEFTEFLRYARGMRFAEDPNYIYLKSLFRDALDRLAAGNDSGLGEETLPAVGGFDWLGKSFAVRKEPATHPILPRAEFQKKISVPALTPADKLQMLHQRSSAVAFSARPSSQGRKKRSDGEIQALRNKPLGQIPTTLAQPRSNETPHKSQFASAQRFQGSKQSSARTNQPLADQHHQQETPRITKNSEDMSWNEEARSVGNLSSVQEKHTPPEHRSEKVAATPQIVVPPTPERTRKNSPGVSVPPHTSLLSVRSPSASKSVSSPLSKSTKNLFRYSAEELAKLPVNTAVSPLSTDNDSSDDDKEDVNGFPRKPTSQTGLLTLPSTSTIASSTDGEWSHVAHAPLKMSPVPLPEAKDFSIDLSQKKTVEDGVMLPKPKLSIPIQVQPSSRTALNDMKVAVTTPKGTTKVGPLRALLPRSMSKGEQGPKKTQPTIQIRDQKSPTSPLVPPNTNGGVDPKSLHRISTYDVKRDGSEPMPSIFRASCFGWLRKRAVCPGSRMHRSTSLQYPPPGNVNVKTKLV